MATLVKTKKGTTGVITDTKDFDHWPNKTLQSTIMKKLYIGIDGGRETGLAVWNSETKLFEEIITTDFWGAIERIKSYHRLIVPGIKVLIENPAGNAPVFKVESVYRATVGNHFQKLSASAFVASSVGSVKRESELLIEFCKQKGIPYRALTPGKRSMTKLDAKKFKQYTGYSERTSQHGRDSAMLVFQL